MKKVIILLIVILFFGCRKDDSEKIDDPVQQNPDLFENVMLISDGNSKLVSSDSDLSKGIYSIEFSDDIPEIEVDDILVGDEGEGFLRKVESLSKDGNILTMVTSQAKMVDVFKNATIEFSTNQSSSYGISNVKSEGFKINYLAEGVKLSKDGTEYDISNTTLYEKDGLVFKITNGKVVFEPNFHFNSEYSLLGGLDLLEFESSNANLNINCDISLNASSEISLLEFSTEIANFDKTLKILVAGIPVIVSINTRIVAELSTIVGSNFEVTTGFTNNYTLTTGVRYESEKWDGSFDLNPNLTSKPVEFGGETNIIQNLTITPKVSLKFYGIIGPYCQPRMTEDFSFNIASPSLDWDSELEAGLNLTTGVDITIFGHDVADFSRTDNFEETIWYAPDSLEIISGDNQVGEQGQQLIEPLKVKVTDNLDNTLSNAPVYFTVKQGGGAVDGESVMTDENGFAEVFWTLGVNTELQSVEVTVKKADGSNIENSPIIFNATSENPNPNPERLFAYLEYDDIVELDIQTGNEIAVIADLGPDYYYDFFYISQSEEILAHDYENTYKININTGSINQFSSDIYDMYAMSNSQNRLFARSYGKGTLVELNILDGSVISTFNVLNKEYDIYHIAFSEQTNELLVSLESDAYGAGIVKLNVNTGNVSKLSTIKPDYLIISNKQNRLFAYVYDDDTGDEKIIEIDLSTGNRIGDIAFFDSAVLSDEDFILLEDTNEIICQADGNTIKIDIDTGSITQLSSIYYGGYIRIK